jgi:hypothetical protein
VKPNGAVRKMRDIFVFEDEAMPDVLNEYAAKTGALNNSDFRTIDTFGFKVLRTLPYLLNHSSI